jgi:hypothetical protein
MDATTGSAQQSGQEPLAGEDLEDRMFDAVRARLESLIGWGRSSEAIGLEHAPLEERVLAEGFEVMRLFTEAHLGLRTAREERRSDVVDADGDVRVTVETGKEHSRTMLFGSVRTSRMAYRRHHKTNLYPQDAALNWAGAHSYSAGVVKRVARAVASVPFEQAGDQVAATTAITIGKRQVEALAVGAAVDFEAYYAARRPGPRPDDVGLLITADGSAFPVLPQALRPATAMAAAARAKAATGWPENPGPGHKATKRSAELVCVADIPKAPRTTDEVITAVFGPHPKTGQPGQAGTAGHRPGPVAEGKTVFASAAHPIAAVIADGFAEAERRDPGHDRTWYALLDGNNAQIDAINAQAHNYDITVPILIDFIHVVQYLWKAAGSFFYTGDPAARTWVVDQSRKILDGKATDVAAGIRRRATRFGYTGKEREGADTAATYLDHKAAYLDYPTFLAAGRPIATGLIEGACRWLIKDRMQVTGARWTLDNAEAVLKLRALAGNGDFDDYFTYHLQQEKHRNHDNLYQQIPA